MIRNVVLLGILATLWSGCSDQAIGDPVLEEPNTIQPAPNNNPSECTPDASEWEAIAPIVTNSCAGCHGPATDYGAPYDLSSLDALMTREFGVTRAELSARRVAQGTMPPIGMPGLSAVDAQAFVKWATCGGREVDDTPRMTVNRPVFLGPETAPDDWEYVDMLADNFEVRTDYKDHYQCFTFEVPFEADRFVRRIEIVEDRSEVLHHVVLLRDNDKLAPLEPYNCVGMPAGSDYLYAWAPGTGPVQFDDGGMRAKPGERFVLQLHYNNGAQLPDVRDSSGIRVYHGPVEGTEYGMVAVGPLVFQIPGRTEKDVTGQCGLAETTTILAGMPHMHDIGKGFEQTITRANGDVENLISLQNWDFETQLFYRTPVTLEPGDVLNTTCTFDNPGLEMVTVGPKTSDEMCFNFMYVTPPPTSRYCDEVANNSLSDVTYSKGMCAPESALENPELVQGRFVVGTPEALNGGVLADGVYALNAIEIWRQSAETPVGELDLERSKILARGQLIIANGELTFDADIASDVWLLTGQNFTQPGNVSLSAARIVPEGSEGSEGSEDTSPFLTSATCAQAPPQIPYEVNGDAVTMTISGNAFNVAFESLYVFAKVQ